MENKIEIIGNEKMPSVLNNPFLKNCITSIRVMYIKSVFEESWNANGFVSFKNNNTEGEQKFKGETFDEVVIKIKAFITELEANTNP